MMLKEEFQTGNEIRRGEPYKCINVNVNVTGPDGPGREAGLGHLFQTVILEKLKWSDCCSSSSDLEGFFIFLDRLCFLDDIQSVVIFYHPKYRKGNGTITFLISFQFKSHNKKH